MAKSLLLQEKSDCRELIKRVLLEKGHDVAAFAEEQEALAWVRTNPVDLAIVSLGSRGTDNQAWKKLKALNKDLKIIVLSRYTFKELASEALAQGADDYLIKPIDIELLETKVKNLKLD
ncbi:MAG: response regulator [Deltaproteobacteria bacterium]|nr:MAG: response regulator [Deltaproteobacteria bacterium]